MHCWRSHNTLDKASVFTCMVQDLSRKNLLSLSVTSMALTYFEISYQLFVSIVTKNTKNIDIPFALTSCDSFQALLRGATAHNAPVQGPRCRTLAQSNVAHQSLGIAQSADNQCVCQNFLDMELLMFCLSWNACAVTHYRSNTSMSL